MDYDSDEFTPEDVYDLATLGDVDNLYIALSVGDNSKNWFKGHRQDEIGYYNEEVLALHRAAQNGHLECVKALLNCRSDINCTTSYAKETPLHLATREGHKSIVTLLIERGVNINKHSNGFGYTREDGYTSAIAKAALFNYEDIVAMLYNAGATDITDLEEALSAAAVRGSLGCVEFLLDIGVDVNSNVSGNIPILEAVWYKRLNCAKYLILRGANVNGHSDDGLPLTVAANKGHIEICKLLLDNKADIVDDIYEYEREEGDDCRPIIVAEIEHRRKRAAFDSFIAHHIEYPLYKNSIYSICCPDGNMLRAEPAVGWSRAEDVRDKYYFDETFFYLHLYTGKIVSNATSDRYSSIIALARDSDATSTLMTVLSDRLKMYLRPTAL